MKGMVCGIDTVFGLVEQLLESRAQRYILMYKFSQDHLELFFNAIRGSGKCETASKTGPKFSKLYFDARSFNFYHILMSTVTSRLSVNTATISSKSTIKQSTHIINIIIFISMFS